MIVNNVVEMECTSADARAQVLAKAYALILSSNFCADRENLGTTERQAMNTPNQKDTRSEQAGKFAPYMLSSSALETPSASE